MNTRNLVFVFRSAPYSSPTAQEGLDALLAAAVFDQQITLIFMGDAVWQLHSGQAPAFGKNQMKMLQSLSLYDIDQVFVQETALGERGMNHGDLNIQCTLISDLEVHSLMQKASHVLSF